VPLLHEAARSNAAIRLSCNAILSRCSSIRAIGAA
jgi:hypothetical protein